MGNIKYGKSIRVQYRGKHDLHSDMHLFVDGDGIEYLVRCLTNVASLDVGVWVMMEKSLDDNYARVKKIVGSVNKALGKGDDSSSSDDVISLYRGNRDVVDVEPSLLSELLRIALTRGDTVENIVKDWLSKRSGGDITTPEFIDRLEDVVKRYRTLDKLIDLCANEKE